MIRRLVSIIWLVSQLSMINCREISESSGSPLNNELEPCYHAERLLQSGISPDLVIRTLEATGQVTKGFLDETPSTVSHASHEFRRSSQLNSGRVDTGKSRQSNSSSKQAGDLISVVTDSATPYPVIFPADYVVSPKIKLTNKLKNKYRSEINTLTNVVANNANLLQAYPMEIYLDSNKYKKSDVNLSVKDLELNVASGLRSEDEVAKKEEEEPKNDILNRRASATTSNPSSRLCDDFVARGIRGRNNLLNHLFTRAGTRLGVQSGGKKGNYLNNEGDVVIKSKAINGKDSNIRSVKDVVLGVATLDESFDILDIMDDDDYKDSKVSAKELYVKASATLNG